MATRYGGLVWWQWIVVVGWVALAIFGNPPASTAELAGMIAGGGLVYVVVLASSKFSQGIREGNSASEAN